MVDFILQINNRKIYLNKNDKTIHIMEVAVILNDTKE